MQIPLFIYLYNCFFCFSLYSNVSTITSAQCQSVAVVLRVLTSSLLLLLLLPFRPTTRFVSVRLLSPSPRTHSKVRYRETLNSCRRCRRRSCSSSRCQDNTTVTWSENVTRGLFCFSDDSTPGAIVVSTTKNGSSVEQDSAIKRFLQCPGMCRVDVLKKFVRNKYNVDTKRFYVRNCV